MTDKARLRNGWLAIGSDLKNGKMVIIDNDSHTAFEIPQGKGAADAIVELNDGNILVASHRADGFFRILDPKNKKVVKSFSQNNIGVDSLLLLTDGRVAAMDPLFDTSITVFDPYQEPRVVFERFPYASNVFSAFNPYLESEMLKGSSPIGRISIETLHTIKNTDHLRTPVNLYEKDNELYLKNNAEIPQQINPISPVLKENTEPKNLEENKNITKTKAIPRYPSIVHHSIMAPPKNTKNQTHPTRSTQSHTVKTIDTDSCRCNLF